MWFEIILLVIDFNLTAQSGNRGAALKYRGKRRRIDPALYNERRLREKPYPKSKSTANITARRISPQKTLGEVQSTSCTPPNSPFPTTNTLPNLPAQTAYTPPNSPLPTCYTPPNSPLPTTDESEHDNEVEIICVTDQTIFQRHRPFTSFDIISGRFSFELTVCVWNGFKGSYRIYLLNIFISTEDVKSGLLCKWKELRAEERHHR